jgi:hypothetical protein
MPTRFPEFWAEMGKPIPQNFVRERSQGGRTFSYITARTVQNRLDAVAGPENWNADYRPWGNGMRCDLTIVLPDGSSITKWDVGGFSSMQDDGDNEKAGLSDALKRAAVLFGIGRELYGDDSTVPHLPDITARIGIPQSEENGFRRCSQARREEYREAAADPGWASPVVDFGTYVPPVAPSPRVETLSTPRPQPASPVSAPFDAPPPARNTIDDLKASGVLKTGGQVYGTPTAPPPQRDLSRGDVMEAVGDMLSSSVPSEPPPFLPFLQRKCHEGNEVFFQKCDRQRLRAPQNGPVDPNRLAVAYCHRAIDNGGVDVRQVSAGGQYIPEACLEALESHYLGDPKATEKNLNIDIDRMVSDEIAKIEVEKHKQENGGQAPNRSQPPQQTPPQHRGGGDVPKTGRALFARIKEIEQREEVALTKWITSFSKLHNLPERMVDLDPDQIAFVYEAALEKVASFRREENPEALAN